MAEATVPGEDLIDWTIAVGPDGTCACGLSRVEGRCVSAAPDVRGVERRLTVAVCFNIRGRVAGRRGPDSPVLAASR